MGTKRDFLTFRDFSKTEILNLFKKASELKTGAADPRPVPPLSGKCVGLLFEKASTRTRVSFEVAVRRLGGYPIFLNWSDTQLGRGEPVRDSARVLSRYLDGLTVRTFGQDTLEEIARWSSMPVINALTDLHHPCQVLADLFTLHERGLDVTSLSAAWIGDGNNMANSWIDAAQVLGFELRLACPKGYEPAISWNGSHITLSTDPKAAMRGVNVVSTDVWTSMGQEAEQKDRERAFQGYQVNQGLLALADPGVYVLHCLPAHRGEEITDEVMECDRSLVWDEAENRLYAQMAVMEALLGR
jgi:ornithine carbamoyltransferase